MVVVFNVISNMDTTADFGHPPGRRHVVVAGVARLGTWIKYIPEPVVIGFTAGIGLVIFSSQIETSSASRWRRYQATLSPLAGLLGSARHLSLSAFWWPLALCWDPALAALCTQDSGFLVAVVGASVPVALLNLPVDTIGSRFGGIPSSLPMPSWPEFTLERAADLLPSAFTIAFLAGVESLLSAVVADGMTGRRHRSNCELVAQGVANSASALFGGLPATGAIARTATNIRAGARSPVSGMLTVFLLLFMLLLSPLRWVPLAAFAAILVIVAWNIARRAECHLLCAHW